MADHRRQTARTACDADCSLRSSLPLRPRRSFDRCRLRRSKMPLKASPIAFVPRSAPCTPIAMPALGDADRRGRGIPAADARCSALTCNGLPSISRSPFGRDLGLGQVVLRCFSCVRPEAMPLLRLMFRGELSARLACRSTWRPTRLAAMLVRSGAERGSASMRTPAVDGGTRALGDGDDRRGHAGRCRTWRLLRRLASFSRGFRCAGNRSGGSRRPAGSCAERGGRLQCRGLLIIILTLPWRQSSGSEPWPMVACTVPRTPRDAQPSSRQRRRRIAPKIIATPATAPIHSCGVPAVPSTSVPRLSS